MKLNRYLLGSALVAALGGFLFGFDTAVISGTTTALREHFHLDWYWLAAGSPEGPLANDVILQVGPRAIGFTAPNLIPDTSQIYKLGGFLLGFTVSSALLGTILGSILAGKPAEAFGRKPVLIVLGMLYLVSSLGCGLAWNWPALLAFRFLGGLAIGGASVVSPMYIAEISPPQLRGRLVGASQFNVVLGILISYLSNFIIFRLTGGDPVTWRWMLGIVAVPSAMFLLLLMPIPESPRWLVKRHRRDEALDVLRRLGNVNAEGVLREIVESLHEETVGADEPFFRAKYLKPILLAAAIASFNQFSGINALIYYTSRIFEMAGATGDQALLLSVVIGLTNLVFTMLAMTVIDHFGRRKLMLVGSVGYILSLGCTAWAFYAYGDAFVAAAAAAKAGTTVSDAVRATVGTGTVVVLASLLVFIASHAFGQGAVIWVFISEIFPNRVRARGQALGSFTHWLWAAGLSWLFPVVAEKSGGLPFALFAAMMVLQLVWVVIAMPETKGVSLEQIQRKLGIE